MKYDYSKVPELEGIGLREHYNAPEPLKSLNLVSFAGAHMLFYKAPEITEAMQQRAKEHFGYTYADKNYLDAICSFMKRRRNWDIDKETIVPFFGILQAVKTSISILTQTGDGIIFLPPSYSMHEYITKQCGRVPVYVPLILNEQSYEIDFTGLEKAMAEDKNKMLLICNPNNPTGTVWSRESLNKIAEIARKYDKLVLSDEVFAEVTFNGKYCTPFAKQFVNSDKAIVCTSISKSFNLVGIAHSNLIIENKEIREKFIKHISVEFQRDMDPFMYAANIASYTKCDEWLDQTLLHIKNNEEILRIFFETNLKQVRVFPLEGTFLVWIDWRELNISEKELEAFLLDEANISIDMGSDYAKEGYCFTRFNLAMPTKELENALSRLYKAAKKRGWVLG